MKTRLIKEQVVRDKRLGRHVQHDPRSRDYPVREVAKVQLRSVKHQRRGSIFDQGHYYDPKTKKYISLGSCTGNAMAGCLNTVPFVPAHGKTKLRHERDAVAIYSQATAIDEVDGEYPPDDTGSSGLAVAKVALAHGWIASYKHAFSLDAALTALQDSAVITGTDWLTGMDRPDANGIVHAVGSLRGGHEYLARGFELASTNDPILDGLVWFDNSWGLDYGIKGHFFMPARDWGNLLEAEGDVTVPIPLAA